MATKMAQYELLERIGKGGMAEIFRASQTAGSGFEKIVAIKRILPHLSQDQRFIELLIAEAKILSELHHRNIVQIYDVGLGNDGHYFLVMEYVDGIDLSKMYDDFTGKRRLPVEVALHICAELCEALEHAHIAKDDQGNSLGLVHRDVSPSNVLLSKHGEVKLTDFGIAKRVDEVTGHGAVRGKFAYISPEQAVNKHVDGRSDVFSVGILLYELVCGRRLYSVYPDFDALREVRAGRVNPSAREVRSVASPLADIIMRALSKNPNDRYQSAGDLGSALRGYRYSLETEIADPGAAIATLVANGGQEDATIPKERRPDYSDDFAEDVGGTVVRINTAQQFHSTDLSGLHQVVNAYPEPRFEETEQLSDMDDADELTQLHQRIPRGFQTHNLSPKASSAAPAMLQAPSAAPAMLQASSVAPAMLQAPSAAPAMLQASSAAPAMLQASSAAPSAPLPLASPKAPVMLPPPKAAPSSNPSPPASLEGAPRLPGLSPHQSMGHSASPGSSAPMGQPGLAPQQRAATAAIHPTGLAPMQPQYGFRTTTTLVPDSQSAANRKMYLYLIGGAVVLVAFLVIGSLLSSDSDTEAASEVAPDAGIESPQSDAALPLRDASIPDTSSPTNKNRNRTKKGNRKKGTKGNRKRGTKGNKKKRGNKSK